MKKKANEKHFILINKLQTYFPKNRLRIRAYALIYAIMVLVLIGVFSSIYLNLYYNDEHRLSMVYLQQDLRKDTKQALLEALEQKEFKDGVFIYNQAPLSKFTLMTSPWGIFNLVEIKGERQTFTEVYSVLTGYEIKTPEVPSLYFEHSDVLKIGGSTLITKKAVVPRKGVERAYINSKGSTRSKLIEGRTEKLTRKSKKLLPQLEVLNYEPDISSDMHSANIITYTPGQNYYNSFANEVMLIDMGESGIVNSQLNGNIKLIGNDSIHISSLAKLKSIQVIAPKIRIEANFEGELQAFAEQSIYVEQGAQLKYPSVLFLSTDSLNSELVVEKYAQVEGAVIATKSKYERYLKSQVEFKKDSKIIGQVITNNINTQSSGKIIGSLMLNTMFLKTKSSIYTNHLLDTEINVELLPKDRMGVEVDGITGVQRIINWVDHQSL